MSNADVECDLGSKCMHINSTVAVLSAALFIFPDGLRLGTATYTKPFQAKCIEHRQRFNDYYQYVISMHTHAHTRSRTSNILTIAAQRDLVSTVGRLGVGGGGGGQLRPSNAIYINFLYDMAISLTLYDLLVCTA